MNAQGEGGSTVDHGWSGSKLDAPRLLHDWGRRAQAVAVIMWKHEMVPGLGVCKSCGRLPARQLPLFGPRCEIAVGEWDLAESALRRLSPDRAPAVGRATVPTERR
ncbi:MAG: hypothetical protein ACRDT4_12935 [Micromonosporaceae bacterium]